MKVLISGAFGPQSSTNPLFQAIANAIRTEGYVVTCLDVSCIDQPRYWEKIIERIFTIPIRMVGLSKDIIKPFFPWTAIAQQERRLLEAVKSTNPDILLVMSFVHYRANVLQSCRDMGVKRLVGWHLEGPTHHIRAENQSCHYDKFFCIHRSIDKSQHPHIEYLPAICLNTDAFYPLEGITQKEEIVFVGARTPRRVEYLKFLKDLPIAIWGPGGWDKEADLAHAFRGESVWGTALNSLYNQSAIVLNLSSWEPQLGGVTQRVIDVPATGAFLLTDDSDEVREIFQPGREIDVFHSPEELRAKCCTYLDHVENRKSIAMSGYERVKSFNTAKNLAQRLLSN